MNLQFFTTAPDGEARKIIRIVSNASGLEILHKTNQRNIVAARKFAMYAIREVTGLSFVKIGKMFGGKHHTTVIKSCRDMAAIETVRRDVSKIRKELEAAR